MNSKICANCNQTNAPEMSFCINCGAEFSHISPDEPPPTVMAESFGTFPQAGQNYQQPNFQSQNQPPIASVPRKSMLPKILLVVGIIIGLVVVGTFGMFVYDKTIGDHFRRQKREREEQNNLQKANSLTAKELLPERITTPSQTVNRGQVIDKFQMFEMVKTKMPEVNADVKDINDAASAGYASADKREAGLFIFKYNTPEQAKNACQKIGQEMIKNEKNFVKKPWFGYDDRIGSCGISGEMKNSNYVIVTSVYGFLYISSGYKDYASELDSQVWMKLR